MTGRLQGKRAFVLGASSEGGIGEAIAQRFVAEGVKVVVGGRDPARTKAIADKIGAGHIVCDIADEAAIERGAAEASQLLGGMDVAVNAAGINHSCRIADETAETLLTQAKVHFVGPTLFIRYCAAQMLTGGSIMTLSSLTVELTGPGLAAYSASKAAADKTVRVAAVEYGPAGIRVNSLAPGLTSTRMAAAHFANEPVIGAFRRETPTGHLSSPQDVAAAALWLASDECTATGDLIRVSSGMHLRRLPTASDFQA